MLEELKQQLETFTTSQCGMYHEVVKVHKSTGEPIVNTIGNCITFQRPQLCKNRNNIIGCAHTKANHTFKNLIKDINDKEIQNLINQFDQLILQIYKIDHKKGNLEGNYAESLLAKNNKEQEAISQEIQHCISKHKVCIDKLEKVRVAILNRIDNLLILQE